MSVLLSKIKIRNKVQFFGRVLWIYWLLFWPITWLMKWYFGEDLGERGVFFVVLFYFIFGAVFVFFVQILRAIFNEQKKYYKLVSKTERKKFIFWITLFALWSVVFVLSFIYKAGLTSVGRWFEDYSIPLYQEIIFFFIALFGEVVLHYNFKYRKGK